MEVYFLLVEYSYVMVRLVGYIAIFLRTSFFFFAVNCVTDQS